MSRLSFTHPSRVQLDDWLNGVSSDDAVITLHVDQCDRCAAKLDAIAGGDDDGSGRGDDVDSDLARAIRDVYEPPADLNNRVMKKIDERERAEAELNLFLGLFAIGKDAAELMMPRDGDDI